MRIAVFQSGWTANHDYSFRRRITRTFRKAVVGGKTAIEQRTLPLTERIKSELDRIRPMLRMRFDSHVDERATAPLAARLDKAPPLNEAARLDKAPPLNEATRLDKAPPMNNKCIVAVSGGLDSMVLVHVLHKLGWKIQLAHVNYGLRGADSIEDGAFVRAAAQRMGLPFHILDVSGQKPDVGSIQEWARTVRYDWFEALARELNVLQVMVAHHADDQLETLLLNLNRGSGIAGLKGMNALRSSATPHQNAVVFVRPMLSILRAEIQHYAVQHGLEWREDGSNTDLRYARNALRNELNQMEPAQYQELVQSGLAISNRVTHFYEDYIAPMREPQPMDLAIVDVLTWPKWFSGWVILEFIQALDPDAPRRKSVVRSIWSLVRAHPGKMVQFGNVCVWKNRHTLAFRKARSATEREDSEWTLPELRPSFDLMTPFGTLAGQLIESGDDVGSGDDVPLDSMRINPKKRPRADQNKPFDQGPFVATLDADKIMQPMVLRKWRSGDRFHPLGLEGSQKIKAFLTNSKIPSSAKRDAYVVQAGPDIVWVVGHRIDNRYKITPSTRRVVRFQWDSKSDSEKS